MFAHLFPLVAFLAVEPGLLRPQFRFRKRLQQFLDCQARIVGFLFRLPAKPAHADLWHVLGTDVLAKGNVKVRFGRLGDLNKRLRVRLARLPQVRQFGIQQLLELGTELRFKVAHVLVQHGFLLLLDSFAALLRGQVVGTERVDDRPQQRSSLGRRLCARRRGSFGGRRGGGLRRWGICGKTGASHAGIKVKHSSAKLDNRRHARISALLLMVTPDSRTG